MTTNLEQTANKEQPVKSNSSFFDYAEVMIFGYFNHGFISYSDFSQRTDKLNQSRYKNDKKS